MDRFDAMQAFVRVVEAGSFTKAAETLRMSKTTMTQLVQQLETRLRVKLLNRTTRKLSVTADGAAYYERVVKLLADLDDAETSLSSSTATPSGRLRIDVPSPMASLVIVPALPDFYERYPDIQIDLGVSDRRVDVIGDNVDCVLRSGPLNELSMKARHVTDLALSMCAAPSYLDRSGLPSHPAVLDNTHHRVVGFLSSRTGRIVSPTLHRDRESVAVQGPYVVAVDDGNACLAAGLAGLGIVCLPEYITQAHLSSGRLVRLFEAWSIDPMPMYVAYSPNRHVSAKLRVFIDWIVDLMARQTSVEVQAPP